MSGFVVIVDFKIVQGAMQRFRSLMDRNAIDSCNLETGCRRFDVMIREDSPDSIFLYEIYDDHAAFETHLKSAHFQTFNSQSSELVISKDVQVLTLVCEGSRQGHK